MAGSTFTLYRSALHPPSPCRRLQGVCWLQFSPTEAVHDLTVQPCSLHWLVPSIRIIISAVTTSMPHCQSTSTSDVLPLHSLIEGILSRVVSSASFPNTRRTHEICSSSFVEHRLAGLITCRTLYDDLLVLSRTLSKKR